jgi:hypothetical protein
VKEKISVNAYRENPTILLDVFNKFLDGSGTGTVQIELRRVQAEFLPEDYEKARRERITKWINDNFVEAYPEGIDEGGIEALLLDYDTYQQENQLVELVPPPTMEINFIEVGGQRKDYRITKEAVPNLNNTNGPHIVR